MFYSYIAVAIIFGYTGYLVGRKIKCKKEKVAKIEIVTGTPINK